MKIIVVGAGLAGLTCAKVLTERGAEVVLFEASTGSAGACAPTSATAFCSTGASRCTSPRTPPPGGT
jgi:uncharacterized protein with NAD-binding domain and iron-sulfur cluster